MIDSFTGERFQIHTDGNSGPYIIVRSSQLAQVHGLLDRSRIPHLVDENAIHENDKQAAGVVTLLTRDVARVQTILDEAN